MIRPLEIKIQGLTDFCTGCVISSIAEEYIGEPCDESYSFAMGKLASGEPLYRNGCPPKSAILGAIKYGVLPKSKSSFTVKEQERDFLADAKNWEQFRQFAIKPFGSFHPAFNWDSILEKTSIFAGIYWQGEWDDNPIIPEDGGFHKLTPHEVRIIGKDNGRYVIQNSRGRDIGDQGLWYLPEGAKKYIFHSYYLDPKPWNPITRLISYIF